MTTFRTSLDLIVDVNLTKRLLISILEIKNIVIITHSTLANCNPPEILTSMLLSKVSSIMKNSNDATTLFFYKNIFYKNIDAEICEILRHFNNKAEAEVLKRIDIILCVETFVNTIQFYVFNLTV